MGSLLNKLETQGSTFSQFDGATPPVNIGATDQSTLHNTYSINGTPTNTITINPSILDLDGKTPPKYLDNLPK
jgi:hypothetical protein